MKWSVMQKRLKNTALDTLPNSATRYVIFNPNLVVLCSWLAGKIVFWQEADFLAKLRRIWQKL